MKRLSYIQDARCLKVNFTDNILFPAALQPDLWSWHPLTGFRNHLIRHATIGRIPLDEWSARRRDLYLTTQNTQKRKTSEPPAGFEPKIPTSKRPQTHTLDRTATGIGLGIIYFTLFFIYYYKPFMLMKIRKAMQTSSIQTSLYAVLNTAFWFLGSKDE